MGFPLRAPTDPTISIGPPRAQRYVVLFAAAVLLVVAGTVHGVVRAMAGVAYAGEPHGSPAAGRRRGGSPGAAGDPAILAIHGLTLGAGADHEGFALDGSGWRAVRSGHVPAACSPADSLQVWIRLPARFRSTADGIPSRATYRLNLALVEAALVDAGPRAGAGGREVGPVEEALVHHDLDADGHVLAFATHVRDLPPHYAGAAAELALEPRAFPVGTELLRVALEAAPHGHPQTASLVVRHAAKRPAPRALGDTFIGTAALSAGAGTSAPESAWELSAHEQVHERWVPLDAPKLEACVACHLASRLAVDGSFAFARKLPGAAGWWCEGPTLALAPPRSAR